MTLANPICMKTNFVKRPQPERSGAMLPMLGVVMVILFIAATFAVDIARMHLTRSELRTASDAAARAAVEALGRTQNRQAGIDAAIAIAGRNQVAGKPLTITASDVSVGTARKQNDGSLAFNAGGTNLTTVRVNGRRTDDSPDGSVGLMFAPVLGVSDFAPEIISTATRSDRDIALVLDVSGSMSVNGKFNALRDGLNTFLQVLDETPQDEFVSLSTYSSSSRAIQDMTNNLQLIRDGFSRERPGGLTAIGFGLNTGRVSILRDRNTRSFAEKAIVLMTDGRHNTGPPPETVARNCARADIVVHTITFGNGADQSRMRRVADITGGDFFHAANNRELREVFERIARQLSVLLIE